MTLSKAAIEALVIRAQSGEQQAFESLFDHFYPKLFRYIRLRVRADDADDIASETFLKVIKKIKTYRANSFSAWIFRITHNTIIDYYRRHKPTESLTMDDTDGIDMDLLETEPGPDDQLKLIESDEAVRELIAKLPPSQQEILELRFLEDFSNKEIAAITGKSEGNIRIMQMRALRDLRVILHSDEKIIE
jgi:RNA polymerase sigma-70 factor (ECF subfamily)